MRRKRQILIIEDNETLRESLRKALTKEGHEVLATPTAEEGLGLVLGRLFDVILVDLKLPRHDGDSFVRQVRSIGCRAEIVMMTGSTEADPVALKSAGARILLLKDADFFPRVRETIREILSAPAISETAQ